MSAQSPLSPRAALECSRGPRGSGAGVPALRHSPGARPWFRPPPQHPSFERDTPSQPGMRLGKTLQDKPDSLQRTTKRCPQLGPARPEPKLPPKPQTARRAPSSDGASPGTAGGPRPGHSWHRARAVARAPSPARRRYLVGAVQRADEEGDLLHHSQVLLQVLKLLEEARRPEVHLIWAERDPVGGEGTNRNPSRRSRQRRGAAGPPGGLSGWESAGQCRRPGGILGPGGSHEPQDNQAGTPQVRNQRSRACAPQKKLLQRARTPPPERGPAQARRESPWAQQSQRENKHIF